MKIKFRIDAEPVAQPRQRFRIAGEAGKQFVKSYRSDSHPVVLFKKRCRQAATKAYQGEPLKGPLSVSILFVFPRPKNRIWKTKPMPREQHTKKPDADNCCKSVWDALNKVIWKDDSQICEVRARKQVASGDEQPHVIVVVEALTE